MERILIVSTDGHIGLPIERYKEYLDAEFHDAFEDYLAYRKPTLLRDLNKRDWVANHEHRWEEAGKAEAMWDPDRRIAVLEAEGAVAEVLFPDRVRNNEMPFSEPDRPDRTSRVEQMAGERAYNRWVAEFCSAHPSRFAGLTSIQAFLDPAAMIDQIEWSARQPGVRGVLLPGVGPDRGDWLDEKYEPVWSACEDTGMLVHFHVGSGLPPKGSGAYPPTVAGGLLANYEGFQWAHRALWWLVFGGVLERHPQLRVAFTETGSRWVADAIAKMDWIVDMPYRLEGLRQLIPRKPSEYFHRQCALGASILSVDDLEHRDAIGVENIMMGLDLPHFEGTLGLTEPYLRRTFGAVGVPEAEARAILGNNAVAFYDFDADELAAIAGRVGPTPASVLAEPIDDLDPDVAPFGEDHFFWTRKPA